MAAIKAINLERINTGKAHFAELIKILFYKANSDLIELLDLDRDEIFLDPLIYAYFSDANGAEKTTLEQLIYGYIADDLKPERIPLLFDEEGMTYLPEIGYFKALENIKPFQRYYFSGKNSGTYTISSQGGEPLKLRFFSRQFADAENKIELIRFQHPLLKSYFTSNWPGNEREGQPADIEVNEITQYHTANVKDALHFLKTNYNAIYETLVATNRRFMIFQNMDCLCFTHQNLLGISFFSTSHEHTRVFFMEEILHQGSHNIFNTMHDDKFRYFKLNVEEERLGDHIGLPEEHRTIYNVFHGLVTVTHRLICYKEMVEKNQLKDSEMHELYGRYCDQYKRFNTGIELLESDKVYTEQGKELFNEMRTKGSEALDYFKDKATVYNLSNQPWEFNYLLFKELNTL
ncbi:hypothetical protein CNR22_16160 [Sphingobacteriaceae bacterium]|nr:hypothetical protein CNR22_16160 [Sphingobacteriaceae bacterium]